MGIKTLWPRLKSIMERVPVSRFKGQRVALDVSILIHTAVHGLASSRLNQNERTNFGMYKERQKSAEQLEEERRKRDEDYMEAVATNVVNRVLSMIQMEVNLLVVFDGATPPIKFVTTSARAANLEKARAEASQKSGDNPNSMSSDSYSAVADQYKATQKAGATSSEFGFIKGRILSLFRLHGVHFMVSPYEADSQLAYLSLTSSSDAAGSPPIINLVVSSDSDCVALSVPYVLSKLDAENYGDLYSRSSLPSMADFSLLNFTQGMVSTMCILIGCDYLTNLYMLGPETARRLTFESFSGWMKDPKNARPPLEVLLSKLKSSSYLSRLTLGEQRVWENDFLRALVMMRHPVVFDPLENKQVIVDNSDPELVCYPPYADMIDDDEVVQSICGDLLPDDIARGVSFGWINPKGSMELYEDVEVPDDIREAFKQWEESGGRRQFSENRSKRKQIREEEVLRLCEPREGEHDGSLREDLNEDMKTTKEKVVTKKNKKKKKKKNKAGVTEGMTDEQKRIRERFIRLYTKHCPEKLKKVTKLLAKHKDNLLEAIEAAEMKYEGRPQVVSEEKENTQNSTQSSEELIKSDKKRKGGPDLKPGWTTTEPDPSRRKKVVNASDDWLSSDDEDVIDEVEDVEPERNVSAHADKESSGAALVIAEVDSSDDDEDPRLLLKSQNESGSPVQTINVGWKRSKPQLN